MPKQKIATVTVTLSLDSGYPFVNLRDVARFIDCLELPRNSEGHGVLNYCDIEVISAKLER